MMAMTEVQDVDFRDTSLRALRAAAVEHFKPQGAEISGIQTQHIPGVWILGSLMPRTFGRAAFDTFTVTLPKDGKGRETTYEVTERRGEEGVFEVVRTVTKPSRGFPGGTVVDAQDRKAQLKNAEARTALGI